MRNIFIGIFTIFHIIGLQAQVQTITVQNANGQESLIDLPESMETDMDSLYWDWLSKTHLSLDENCQVTTANPIPTKAVNPRIQANTGKHPLGAAYIIGLFMQ